MRSSHADSSSVPCTAPTPLCGLFSKVSTKSTDHKILKQHQRLIPPKNVAVQFIPTYTPASFKTHKQGNVHATNTTPSLAPLAVHISIRPLSYLIASESHRRKNAGRAGHNIVITIGISWWLTGLCVLSPSSGARAPCIKNASRLRCHHGGREGAIETLPPSGESLPLLQAAQMFLLGGSTKKANDGTQLQACPMTPY